jgi:hypothetical protein
VLYLNLDNNRRWKEWVDKKSGSPSTFMAIPDHLTLSALCRVAKWYIFNPNIPIQADFGGHWNSQRCYILWPFVICIFNRLVCFMACLYVLRSFGNFSPILVCWTKKNLATLALCTYVRCWFLDGCLMDRRTVVRTCESRSMTRWKWWICYDNVG